jgi:hypothetical protein
LDHKSNKKTINLTPKINKNQNLKQIKLEKKTQKHEFVLLKRIKT